MKNRMQKQMFCLLLALVLCLSLPVFAGTARADDDQALLVIVDEAALGADAAGKLVRADAALIKRVLADTPVCQETETALNGSAAKVTEAQLHHDGYGIQALATLSDGSTVPVTGQAVLEYRGEYLFGGDKGYMLYGFQPAEGGLSRFYSTRTVQKFDLLQGRMASACTLFVDGKYYTVDKNGYCDTSKPVEQDKELWGRYYRAEYYQGLPGGYGLNFNCFLCTEHDYDFEHPSSSVASTCLEHGTANYICPSCGTELHVEMPLGAHKWGDWTVTKAATATEAGSRSHTCKVCKLVETEVIPATGS